MTNLKLYIINHPGIVYENVCMFYILIFSMHVIQGCPKVSIHLHIHNSLWFFFLGKWELQKIRIIPENPSYYHSWRISSHIRLRKFMRWSFNRNFCRMACESVEDMLQEWLNDGYGHFEHFLDKILNYICSN